MLVVVLESPDTLLPAEARCQLIAALRSVDFVLSATEQEWRSIVSQNNAQVHVIDDLQAERRRSEEFVERIMARQGGAAL